MKDKTFKTCSYNLAPASAWKVARFAAEEAKIWQPNPDLPLEEALPAPWDNEYTQVFRQPFQPVKFWRNANIIASYLDAEKSPENREKAVLVLEALLQRFDEFTVVEDGVAWVENRFNFVQEGLDLPSPWVSAITNAFGILGLRCCLDVFGTTERSEPLKIRIKELAQAYKIHFVEGEAEPDRWISYITQDQHLWFDEYPQPAGQATLVLNGHVFAVLALNEARALWPNIGLETLVNAGALSVAENFPAFTRRGKPPLYSLRGVRKSDYLPIRTYRQQFELYMLTGDFRFLDNSMRIGIDIARHVDFSDLSNTRSVGATLVKRRLSRDTLPFGKTAFLRQSSPALEPVVRMAHNTGPWRDPLGCVRRWFTR